MEVNGSQDYFVINIPQNMSSALSSIVSASFKEKKSKYIRKWPISEAALVICIFFKRRGKGDSDSRENLIGKKSEAEEQIDVTKTLGLISGWWYETVTRFGCYCKFGNN